MQRIHRRQWLAIAGASALALSVPARAQASYPTHPVRMVIPVPAGSSLDVLGRIFASALSSELGQQVVAENRIGATGHIGGEAVARAAADGYTLLFAASSSLVVSPHVMKLNYKPIEELVPVALAATVNNVVVVTRDLPVNSMAEFIAYARANPGKISYGSYGLGSNLHLAGEMLASMAGLQLVHVPYNSTQMLADLLAGRIQMHVGNIVEVEQHIRSGALRALAVTSVERLPEFPQLPTVADTLPGYAVGAWGMLMAPARTPPSVLARLNAASLKALARPEVREAFAKQRFVPASLNVAQSRDFMLAESARWERVAREAKVPMLN